MQVRPPGPLACPARRGAHVEQQDRLVADAHGPPLAGFADPPGAQIAAEIHQRVRAERFGEPVGKPALRDTPEVERGAVTEPRGTHA